MTTTSERTQLSSQSLKRIQTQLGAEAQLVEEIESLLSRLRPSETNQATLTLDENGHQDLIKMLQNVQRVSHARKRLRYDIAQELTSPVEYTKLADRFRKPEQQPGQQDWSQSSEQQIDVEELKTKVARLIGRNKATAESLFLRQEVIQASLAALGVLAEETRYNSAGEKLEVHQTEVQMRS